MKTLVIGGTGMLAGAVRQLSLDGPVYLLARRPERLQLPNATALACDYVDEEALHSVLAAHAPFDRALVWIHNTAPHAPAEVAKHVRGDYWHVTGSALADPACPDNFASLRESLGPRYHRIVLGFVLEGNYSRWLTNDEIGAGVIAAMQSAALVSVIGTVSPWERRP